MSDRKKDLAETNNKQEKAEESEEQESDYELLIRSKRAIQDLTEELKKEKLRNSSLQAEIESLQFLKSRNLMLENERAEYIKENTLLRFFIANIETTPPPPMPFYAPFEPMVSVQVAAEPVRNSRRSSVTREGTTPKKWSASTAQTTAYKKYQYI